MNWLALTFISVLFRATYGLMTKVMSNKLKVISVYGQTSIFLFISGLISLCISPFIGGFHIQKSLDLLVIILVILGQGLGNIIYFEALKYLNGSTAQISFSSILIFNTVFSMIFLNLKLSLINYLGIFLLMIAIVSVLVGKMEFHIKGVSLMVLSAVLFAVYQLSSSELSKQVSAPVYLVIAYFGAAIIIGLFKVKVIRKDLIIINENKKLLATVFYSALLSVLTLYFIYLAYRAAPQASKVVILATSQVVFNVILSYFFLKEKNHLLTKIFAGILVVVSAFLIKG